MARQRRWVLEEERALTQGGHHRSVFSLASRERVRCQISRQRGKPPGSARAERTEAGREGHPVPAPPVSDTKHHHVLSATKNRSQRKATSPVCSCHLVNRDSQNCVFPLSSPPSIQKIQPGPLNSKKKLLKQKAKGL